MYITILTQYPGFYITPKNAIICNHLISYRVVMIIFCIKCKEVFISDINTVCVPWNGREHSFLIYVHYKYVKMIDNYLILLFMVIENCVIIVYFSIRIHGGGFFSIYKYRFHTIQSATTSQTGWFPWCTLYCQHTKKHRMPRCLPRSSTMHRQPHKHQQYMHFVCSKYSFPSNCHTRNFRWWYFRQ